MPNMKKNLQKYSLLLVVLSYFIFIILFSLAIHYYPGGSRFDQFFVGYNFFETFPSDLGRIVAINGQINTLTRVLFIISLITFSVFHIIFYLNLPFLICSRKTTRILTSIATLIGVVYSSLIIAICFTPHDVNAVLHNRLIYSSAPMVFIVSLLLPIAIFLDQNFPKTVGYCFLLLDILFVVFAIATGIGPTLDHYNLWVIRILGHNIFIFCEALIFTFAATFTWNFVKKNQLSHREGFHGKRVLS